MSNQLRKSNSLDDLVEKFGKAQTIDERLRIAQRFDDFLIEESQMIQSSEEEMLNGLMYQSIDDFRPSAADPYNVFIEVREELIERRIRCALNEIVMSKASFLSLIDGVNELWRMSQSLCLSHGKSLGTLHGYNKAIRELWRVIR